MADVITSVAAPDVVGPGRAPLRSWGPTFWLGLGWLAVVTLASVLAPVLPLQDPLKPDLYQISSPPSWKHWFGTDTLGRDTFSRVVYGAQVTMLVGVASVLIGLAIGLVIGLLTGYFRGVVDLIGSWLINVLLAFPPLVLAMGLAAFLGASLRNVIIAVGLIALPAFARLARASTIQSADRDFVLSARALGAKHRRIIVKEVLPSVIPPVLTLAITVVGFAMVTEGALSFVGLGVPLPRPTWGGMINEGKEQLQTNPWLVAAPSVALLLTILSLNVVAERIATRRGLTEVRG